MFLVGRGWEIYCRLKAEQSQRQEAGNGKNVCGEGDFLCGWLSYHSSSNPEYCTDIQL